MAGMAEHGMPRVPLALPFFGIPANTTPIRGQNMPTTYYHLHYHFFNLSLDLWGTRAQCNWYGSEETI